MIRSFLPKSPRKRLNLKKARRNNPFTPKKGRAQTRPFLYRKTVLLTRCQGTPPAALVSLRTTHAAGFLAAAPFRFVRQSAFLGQAVKST
jgi:hypothetical protein